MVAKVGFKLADGESEGWESMIGFDPCREKTRGAEGGNGREERAKAW